jgi:Mrp family chromosome partitioning ATPase
MSKYFRTLNRLEEQKPTGIRGTVSKELASSPPTLGDPRTRSGHDAASEPSRSSLVTLLDSVRATARSSSCARVVFASPEATDTVGTIVSGLALLGRQRGLKILVGQFSESDRGLTLRGNGGGEGSSAIAPGGVASNSAEAIPQDVAEAVSTEHLRSWLQQVSSEYDLMLFQAPHLGDSIEAALLGKECAGLVLVVEPLSTSRRALRDAVARARSSNCTVLGLVIHGGKPWLPRWLRRFLPDQAS